MNHVLKAVGSWVSWSCSRVLPSQLACTYQNIGKVQRRKSVPVVSFHNRHWWKKRMLKPSLHPKLATIMHFLHRRGIDRLPLGASLPFHQGSEPLNLENSRASRERLVMAVNHMTAFVIIFYGLYIICHYGFGWNPLRDPPPPSYTVQIPGLTSPIKSSGLTGHR